SNDDKLFYVRTLWQINPLLNLSAPDEKAVCELTITDCKSFWTTTLTISDLKQTKPSGIPDVSKFCGATQASLSGQEEYESYKLSCRVSVSEKYARFAWRWSIPSSSNAPTVQFNIGNATLSSVSQFENVKMWQEWMDFFINERKQFMTKSTAIETRLSELTTIRGKMQEKIEILVAEKVNHETILMEKFKQVLNAKKKKIKKLTKALNTSGKIVLSQPIHSSELSDDEFTDEIDPNSNVGNEETEASRSKKPRLDDNAEQTASTIDDDNKQSDESLLTKTFRGTVIKSRRMGKKPATASKNTTSIDQFLDPRKNPNIIPSQDLLQEAGNDSDSANDLLSKM
ncbi:1270_t:CDS:2, partial [Gigaspora margarita]